MATFPKFKGFVMKKGKPKPFKKIDMKERERSMRSMKRTLEEMEWLFDNYYDNIKSLNSKDFDELKKSLSRASSKLDDVM
ncbi:MAG: hypothetical protein AM325_016395 [Candidatus Thorarchaeota archaeon SMTZ1-45]